MAGSKRSGPTPRAVVHKRILDAAEDRPDASMEDLANDIAGVSIDLVEEVLEEYGDPVELNQAPDAGNQDRDATTSPAGGTGDEDSADSTALPAFEELSEKQLETLRAVRSRLSATQAEIGEALDLSASAVSNRLQGIEGFEWENRETFVSELFEAPAITDGQGETVLEADSTRIEERLDEIEARLDALSAESGTSELPVDLAHKVIHAVVRSEQLDEAEELSVIKALL